MNKKPVTTEDVRTLLKPERDVAMRPEFRDALLKRIQEHDTPSA